MEFRGNIASLRCRKALKVACHCFRHYNSQYVTKVKCGVINNYRDIKRVEA